MIFLKRKISSLGLKNIKINKQYHREGVYYLMKKLSIDGKVV